MIIISLLPSLQTPGLLYFVCGVLMVLSGAACIFLDETKDKDLDDILSQVHRRGEREITEPDKL